jgi:hypothetical protein
MNTKILGVGVKGESPFGGEGEERQIGELPGELKVGGITCIESMWNVVG